jgi:hypothetical protein
MSEASASDGAERRGLREPLLASLCAAVLVALTGLALLLATY